MKFTGERGKQISVIVAKIFTAKRGERMQIK